jgi:pimeloyl-ACP methyl ester carboxylesterase
VKKMYLASGIVLVLAGACSVQAEDFFFNSAGVRIHYTVEGKGEPVVLIHGWGTDIEWTWGEPGIIKGLADHYQVIAIDNRGHGRSDKPHDPQQYGMNMVSDVIRLLDHLKIQQAHIVGYSMGGRITSVLLADHPERIRTVTIGGYGWEDAEGLRALRIRASQVADSLEQGKGVGPLMVWVTPRGEQPPNAQQMEAFNKMFLDRNDPLAVAAAMRGNPVLQPSEEKLRANKLPELAIVGELDPSRTLVDKLASIKGNLKIVVIPGANHLNAIRMPEFLEALKTFLAAHADK